MDRPFRITAKQTEVGYSAESELEGEVVRVHVNLLKLIEEGLDVDARRRE